MRRVRDDSEEKNGEGVRQVRDDGEEKDKEKACDNGERDFYIEFPGEGVERFGPSSSFLLTLSKLR